MQNNTHSIRLQRKLQEIFGFERNSYTVFVEGINASGILYLKIADGYRNIQAGMIGLRLILMDEGKQIVWDGYLHPIELTPLFSKGFDIQQYFTDGTILIRDPLLNNNNSKIILTKNGWKMKD